MSARGARVVPGRLAGAGLAVLLISGCSSATGPAEVSPGEYRLLATSSGPVSTQDAGLVIAGVDLTFTEGSEVTSTSLGPATASYTLCPPSGTGSAESLTDSVVVDGVQLSHPAVFGDCGVTKPVRITIVDIDSIGAGAGQFPFTRWAEYCAVSDPDC